MKFEVKRVSGIQMQKNEGNNGDSNVILTGKRETGSFEDLNS